MKKVIALLLIFVCIISLCSCSVDNLPQNSPVNDENLLAETEKRTVELTTENINQYLIFSTDLGETEKFDNPYAGKYLYNVKMTIKTSPKQNVEFENLIVYFNIVPDDSTKGYGWDQIFVPKTETKFEGVLNIPFNGEWEESFELESEYKEYVSSNPSLKMVISNVSGIAKQN